MWSNELKVGMKVYDWKSGLTLTIKDISDITAQHNFITVTDKAGHDWIVNYLDLEPSEGKHELSSKNSR